MANYEPRKCKWCGQEFVPKTARDAYCRNTHYQTCVVCGKQFEVDVRAHPETKTCSKECRYKLATKNHDYVAGVEHQREALQQKYGVDNIMKLPDAVAKRKQANREKYGTDWYTQTDEYRERIKETCQEKYGTDHHLSAESVKEKRKQTNLEKYGAENVFAADSVKEKIHGVWKDKYGVINPSQYPEFKHRAMSSGRASKLEQRICDLLDNYRIEYERHYVIRNDAYTHEYDFYIPRYKLLIDADGLYFHGYLDDPNGKQVIDYYDETRLSLVPEGHIFHVIVEGDEDAQLKQLVNILETSAGDLSKYDSYLFEWCRSIEFPYPKYSDDRMNLDWSHLCQYQNDKYVQQCRIGESIIKHFHPSIYSCHVDRCISPVAGWYDDNKLKQVIRNRLIYVNNIDPSKILKGFSVSKICPSVSIFNPILARYLTLKYLDMFHEVFDPFSGFSGRLLGVTSTGRRYIGRDLNETAVRESNQIMKFLKFTYKDAVVQTKNILKSQGEYECLLTCPPYGTKEHYAAETIFKSCDDWIDECLQRFKCKRYVFVVDKTDKYKHNVVETIKSTSHFANVSEYVIVIDKSL